VGELKKPGESLSTDGNAAMHRNMLLYQWHIVDTQIQVSFMFLFYSIFQIKITFLFF